MAPLVVLCYAARGEARPLGWTARLSADRRVEERRRSLEAPAPGRAARPARRGPGWRGASGRWRGRGPRQRAEAAARGAGGACRGSRADDPTPPAARLESKKSDGAPPGRRTGRAASKQSSKDGVGSAYHSRGNDSSQEAAMISFTVNGRQREVDVPPEMAILGVPPDALP